MSKSEKEGIDYRVEKVRRFCVIIHISEKSKEN